MADKRVKLSEASWAAIRHVYQTTNESLRSMGARFNVGATTISQRAAREKWGDRPKFPTVIPLPAGLTTAASGVVGDQVPVPDRPKRTRPDTPEERYARLFRLIDIQLDNMETLMTSGKPLSAADEARKARSLNITIGNLEKVIEAAAAATGGADQAQGAQSKDVHLKAEQLRREIAERLERLNAQWNAQTKAE